ncbi:MAG: cupin domain-containing protein [Sphingomonadaceae bacterium]
MTDQPKTTAPPFEIYRAKDAVDYTDEGPMEMAPMTEAQQAGMAALYEGGMLEGGTVKLLYSRPNMSLTYVWFKAGYPLPLHSHNADCLYFIVTGSIRVGDEELGPGDGFFLGSDVPYSYVPGVDGVELLEFRDSNAYDFKTIGKKAEYWEKLVGNLAAARPLWSPEDVPPSGMKVGAE